MAMNLSVIMAVRGFMLKLNLYRQSRSSQSPGYEDEHDPTFFAVPMPPPAPSGQAQAPVLTPLYTTVLCRAVSVMGLKVHCI
jgi:hypothetical protein